MRVRRRRRARSVHSDSVGCAIEPRKLESRRGRGGKQRRITCGTGMRGAVALPWSKITSRRKGWRRNLGDLRFGRAACCRAGPRRVVPLRRSGFGQPMQWRNRTAPAQVTRKASPYRDRSPRNDSILFVIARRAKQRRQSRAGEVYFRNYVAVSPTELKSPDPGSGLFLSHLSQGEPSVSIMAHP